jgi:hypothetical protein
VAAGDLAAGVDDEPEVPDDVDDEPESDEPDDESFAVAAVSDEVFDSDEPEPSPLLFDADFEVRLSVL